MGEELVRLKKTAVKSDRYPPGELLSAVEIVEDEMRWIEFR